MNGMPGREESVIHDTQFLYTLELISVAHLDCGLTCDYGYLGVFGSDSCVYMAKWSMLRL
jgi:hypothetical protein